MEKRRIFLSRATREFYELTGAIRSEGNVEFPMLEIYDQEHPPGEVSGGAAKITVAKIYEWLRLSTHVFLYVGYQSGAAAEVPPNEINNLRILLDDRSQEVLDTLLSDFRKASVESKEITYTQLEGVIAIALDKEPLVFQLDMTGEKAAASQAVYREWLREYYFHGRDRVSSATPEGLRTASLRQLKKLNQDATLERLARSTAETPLWETILAIAQPEATDDEIEKQVKGIRRFTGSRAVDWVDQALDFGGRKSPRFLLRGLVDAPGTLVRHFLIPFDDELGLLTNARGKWECRIHPAEGKWKQAACFEEGRFWALMEKGGQYSVLELGRDAAPMAKPIRGFSTHSFQPANLVRCGASFFLSCVGGEFQLTEKTEEAGTFFQAAALSEGIHGSSQVLPQFPELSAFPFRRHFNGETYDAMYGDPKWAIVKIGERLSFITLRSGDFLDAFQTVDLRLAGNWEAQGIVSDDELVSLQVNDERSETQSSIPLFPTKGQKKRWVKREATLELLGLSKGKRELFEVQLATEARFKPFCFIERILRTAELAAQTHFRVWLIPEHWSRELIGYLKAFLCGLQPLPLSPIRNDSTELEGILGDAWWRLLWEHRH